MFCSKCGKTLNPAAEACSCGQAVGESRFEGVPYTSAQPRIAPGGTSREDALPYTRTTYTGVDEQMQAGTDEDARTTYRPVYEGASVPEGIRRDVRAAVGYEQEDGEAARPNYDEDPLVREMFEGEDAGIDDFDLSQLRPRPIVSEGRAGISRDVTEYVEKLEASSERGSRRGRRKVYGEHEAAPYEEVREEVFQDAQEDGEALQYDPRATLRLVAKIAGALAVLAILFVGGKLIYDRVTDIKKGGAPIEGVTLAVYDSGIQLINQHADTAYVDSILSSAESGGVISVTPKLNDDAQAVKALIPAEPAENDQLFVDALSVIQTNIGNAITMDVLDMSGTVDAEVIAKSEQRWQVVRNSIAELSAAKTAAELTAILGGEKVDVVRPTETASATATPVPYKKLAKGDKSEDVLKMQQRLFDLGYLKEGIDGAFGNDTQTAVKQFQSAIGMTEPDGIAYPEMLAVLYSDDAPPTLNAKITPTPAPDLATEPTLLTNGQPAA